MKHLQQRFCVSERRACQIVDQPRSSQRYISRKAGKDAALSHRMVALSRNNPRYGYRTATGEYGHCCAGKAGR